MSKSTEKLAIQNYFDQCQKQNQPLSVAALAQSLGLTRQELLVASQGHNGQHLKQALLKCEAFLENLLLESKNQTGLIFCLKNNFGWNDKAVSQKEASFEIELKYPWEKN